MRLIDADSLFRKFEKAEWYDNYDRDEIAEEFLMSEPIIDAMPVIRCMDCKYWSAKTGLPFMSCLKGIITDAMNCGTSYCSRAERREE